jgi:hypothetical protein
MKALIYNRSNIGRQEQKSFRFMCKVNDSDGPLKTLKGFQRVNAAGKPVSCINLPYTSFEFLIEQ